MRILHLDTWTEDCTITSTFFPRWPSCYSEIQCPLGWDRVMRRPSWKEENAGATTWWWVRMPTFFGEGSVSGTGCTFRTYHDGYYLFPDDMLFNVPELKRRHPGEFKSP